MAVKYAKVATGRAKTLSFHDSFHGSGYGAVSIGGRPDDRDPRIGPLLPGAIHVPSFYGKGPGAGPAGSGKEEHAEICLAALRSALMIGDASLDVASDLPLGHYTHEKNPFTCRAAPR